MLDSDLSVIRPGRTPTTQPQQAHLRRCYRWFGALALAPFVIGFTCSWTMLIGIFLLVLAGPVVGAAYIISGLVFTVRGAKAAVSAATTRLAWATGLMAPGLTMAVVLLAWPSFTAGILTGELSRLFINLPRYEAIISKTQTSADQGGSDFRDTRGIRYIVDRGPPVRVAFNPEGLLDNWSGIIFDPTGEVMLADGFDQDGNFSAPDHVTKLFGGDLVGCRHLWRHYYSCSFT